MDFDRFPQWFIRNHPQGLEYMELGYEYSRTLWRERSIFFRGYRYTSRDQDTAWPAAYESVRRGYGESINYKMDYRCGL